ncbi:branched-chain amino acid aminotransferase [Daejeonella oryzae]|uniref:branched-chain amino acid aminotransferase n=1 Tax=Daejeonella oryzae TaxID=1122943 RepID=UPI000479CAF6|nr:branched-chain amino acid aminotransferase [Daejeonella oryzae]
MIDTLNIKVNKTPASRLEQTDFSNLAFGRTFSDHMFVADFEDGEWKNLQIMPYGDLPFSPAMSALHYGQAIFEGIKAYKLQNGDISIFRPLKNYERFNISAERMSMPAVPEDLFMQGMTQLIALDKNWVPGNEGQSLYIRPVMFATDPVLGVHASETYKFIILTGPSGAYYSKPLRVKIETHYARAAEGGVGYAKTAGNYGRALLPTKQAQKEGFDQLIWTDARDHGYIEESGTMNVMFVIDDVLITPSTRDTILDGVTRKSILQLAQSWGVKVEERRVTVEEVVKAAKEGTLQEAFGAGTAATVAHIAQIGYESEIYTLPEPLSRKFSNKVSKALSDIRYGITADEFGWNYIL